MAKISVIVPVYGVEEHLDACVSSIVGQTYHDLEIILVDDGSPDSCPAICDRWAERDARIVVIHQANGGVSRARNAGIERATGEFLSFVDADDVLAEDFLSYLASLLFAHPECAFAAGNHLVVRKEKKTPNAQFEGETVLSRREAFFQVLYHGLLDVSPWGKLYRKELFQTLRFPEGIRYEDTYLFGDVLLSAESVVYGGSAKYEYIQHTASFVGQGFSPERLRYVDAAKRLAETAVSFDPTLEKGAVRRIAHARLSTLRYMEKCPSKYRPVRDELRREILAVADGILQDPNTPRRDRLAIRALKMGFFPFFTAWKLYGMIR